MLLRSTIILIMLRLTEKRAADAALTAVFAVRRPGC